MMIAKPITGKTVVVTGGSSRHPMGTRRDRSAQGIGLGLVKKFLLRDNTVIATSRNGAEATQLLQLRAEYPERLHITDLDTAAASSIAAWAAGVKGAGVKRVDVLVNNAGVYGRRLSLEEFEEEDFLFAFRANAMGPFFVVQQLIKQELLGSPSAPPDSTLIINISSVVGSNAETTVSTVTKGGFAYRASKAALNVISTTLARDLAPSGVQVVALHPGYVRTDLTGGNGWVDVDESTEGMFSVLESGVPLNGRFLSYKGEEIPW